MWGLRSLGPRQPGAASSPQEFKKNFTMNFIGCKPYSNLSMHEPKRALRKITAFTKSMFFVTHQYMILGNPFDLKYTVF